MRLVKAIENRIGQTESLYESTGRCGVASIEPLAYEREVNWKVLQHRVIAP